jgi:hypothetical protein
MIYLLKGSKPGTVSFPWEYKVEGTASRFIHFIWVAKGEATTTGCRINEKDPGIKLFCNFLKKT